MPPAGISRPVAAWTSSYSSPAGIEVAEQDHLEAARTWLRARWPATAARFFSLMPNLPWLAPVASIMSDMPARDLVRVPAHDLDVLVEERLALGAVGDDALDARGRLDVGGEPSAAGADDAHFLQTLAQHGGVYREAPFHSIMARVSFPETDAYSPPRAIIASASAFLPLEASSATRAAVLWNSA